MLKNLLYFAIGGMFLALASATGSVDSFIVNLSELPEYSQVLFSWSLFGIFTYFVIKGGITE